MAQMKAYTMPMKNLTLICVPEFLCRKVLKKSMCLLMPSNHHLVSSNLVHPIKYAELDCEQEKSAPISKIF